MPVAFRVAGSSMAAFRPASGLSDAAYARCRYELVTMPAGRLWIAVGIGTVIALGTILTASPAALEAFGGKPMLALVVFGPAAVFGYAMFPVVTYQTVRSLRQVERLHRDATALDLFDTAPIFAFSRLTAQIGIAFVFASYYALIANADFQDGNTISLAVVAGSILVAGACFIVPLWGIHGRLITEKDILVRGASLRARAVLEELYRRVDASDLAGVKDVTDALGGIRATREEIGRLPTWPWPPQVLRGFISAIVLPVVVYLVTRYIGQRWSRRQAS